MWHVVAALLCAVGVSAAAVPSGFVTRDGTRFVLDGAPFYVVGANQCARAPTFARVRMWALPRPLGARQSVP